MEEKIKKIVRLIFSVTLVFIAANAVAQANTNAVKLANQFGCTSCHNAEVKLVGPAFKSVAEKYAGQADAVDTLVKKVTNGGSGNWGRIPMPAHPQVGADNIKTLVEWVLRGAPNT